MVRHLVLLVTFAVASAGPASAAAPVAVTFEIRDHDGSVVLKREVVIQPEDANLTPTQLLQQCERDTKAAVRWSFYWRGTIYRWDQRSGVHRKFFRGALDGRRCKIHARDLVTGDMIVLLPEAF